MIAVLRSEWIKLRTVRMHWVLVIVAVAFPMVITVLTSALSDTSDMDTEGLAGLVVGLAIVTALLLGVLATASVGSEFAHGTIRPTFAATPRRTRVVLAKAIVVVASTLVVAGAVVAGTFAAGAAIARSRDVRVSFDDAPGALPGMVGVVLLAVIVALLGFGLGLVIRNQAAAIAALILWPLLVESLVAGLLTAVGVDRAFRYMPYNSGFAMANPTSDAAEVGRVQGGLYFFAVTLAVVVVGAVLTERRDA